MNCIICKEDQGERPPNVLIQHKAEGIEIKAICQRTDCWIALGKLLSEGRR